MNCKIAWAEEFVPMRFSSLALALNFKTLSMLLLVRFPQVSNRRNFKNNLSKQLIGNRAKFLYTLLLFLASRVLIIWWKVWS